MLHFYESREERSIKAVHYSVFEQKYLVLNLCSRRAEGEKNYENEAEADP